MIQFVRYLYFIHDSFYCIVYNLGRGTGVASIVIDPITQAIMAVGVKEWRPAGQERFKTVMQEHEGETGLVSNFSFEITGVPTASTIIIIVDSPSWKIIPIKYLFEYLYKMYTLSNSSFKVMDLNCFDLIFCPFGWKCLCHRGTNKNCD